MVAGRYFRSGSDDERDVRILGFSERRGHTDDHDVGSFEHRQVCGRLVASQADQGDQILACQIRRVGLAGLERTDTVEVGVDADDAEAGACELDRQR